MSFINMRITTGDETWKAIANYFVHVLYIRCYCVLQFCLKFVQLFKRLAPAVVLYYFDYKKTRTIKANCRISTPKNFGLSIVFDKFMVCQ